MIKDFENFSKKQALANRMTQWCKKYDNGETACLIVDDIRVTREKVTNAFSEQEYLNSEEGKEELSHWNT